MRYAIACSNKEEVFSELSKLNGIFRTQKSKIENNYKIYFNSSIITIIEPFPYNMCGTRFDVFFLEKDYVDDKTLWELIKPSSKKVEIIENVKNLRCQIEELERKE